MTVTCFLKIKIPSVYDNEVFMAFFMLLLTPIKNQAAFLSLYFLTQGILGPVPAELLPNKQEVNNFHKRYYQSELAQSLPYDTYFYGFINRLDIGSRKFMSSKLGQKTAKVPLAKIINVFFDNEKPLYEAKQFLNKKLNLSAKDIYSLTQSKMEFALPNYGSKFNPRNLLAAYFPASRASRNACEKLIFNLEKIYGSNIKRQNTRHYLMWKFSIDNDSYFLAKIKRKQKPYYVITFSEKGFNNYIKNRFRRGKSLSYKLRKQAILKRMGKGVYSGFYVSFKSIMNTSKKRSRSYNDFNRKLYNAMGVQSLFISSSYQKTNYVDRMQFIFDPQRDSLLKKLTPMPVSPKDFHWLPEDTRLLWNLSIKELPDMFHLLGDFIYAIHGKSEYRDYKRELNEFSRETGINPFGLADIFSGKATIAFNANQTYLEDITTDLRQLEKTFWYFCLKRVIIGLRVKDSHDASRLIYTILKAFPLEIQTPTVKMTQLNQTFYKAMIRFKWDKTPISIYWTFLGKQLVICFREGNIRKVISSAKSGKSSFYKRLARQKKHHDMLSYFWSDNSFLFSQPFYFFEVLLAKMKLKEFYREKGVFYFKTLFPLLREMSAEIGSSQSFTRLRKNSIVSETVSRSGIDTGNAFTLLATYVYNGFYMFYMPFMMSSEKMSGKTESSKETTEPDYAPKSVAKKIPKRNKRPDSFILADYGSARTLDPAVAYDWIGTQRISQMYETLIRFDGASTEKFVPVLATEVPTIENGGISKDGKTYTFTIRKDVKFHDGSELTPEDIVYSFKRNMIADPDGGPMWMLLEALTGSGNTRERNGEIIPGTFEKIDKSVEAKGDKVIFYLSRIYPPFMGILISTTGVVLSKKWCVSKGCWDGDIYNAAKYNNPKPGYEPLQEAANGTGPYRMKSWKHYQEFVFERHEGYWGKKPALKYGIIKYVPEWSTRKLMLQNGDVDRATVPAPNYQEVKAMNGLKFLEIPQLSVTCAMFCQKVNPQGNPNIGSGKLDGDGIPPDFFADINVRKAFLHCFDRKTYKKDVFNDVVIIPSSPNVKGLAYHKEVPVYEFNKEKAAEYMKKAWGGKVWEKGFKMTITHNAGRVDRQAAAKMIAENVMALNPKFRIEVRNVPWRDYTVKYRQYEFPIFLIGWGADYPDPHNFLYTYMHSQGVYARYAAYKNQEVDKLAQAGINTIDPEKRKEIYHKLQQLWYDEAIGIPLYQQVVLRAYRDNVYGYVANPMLSDPNEEIWRLYKKSVND